MARNKYWYVNTYECGRAYGGPEEGGWWYAYGTPTEKSIVCATEEEAWQKWEERVNAWAEYNAGHEPIENLNGDGVIRVFVETHRATKFPKSRPYYS